MSRASAAQLPLFRRPVPSRTAPTRAEKEAVRAAQAGRCARCGGVSKNGRRLDVVRGPGGALIGYCLSDRLSWDAPERCRKRRHRAHPKPRSAQRPLRGIG